METNLAWLSGSSGSPCIQQNRFHSTLCSGKKLMCDGLGILSVCLPGTGSDWGTCFAEISWPATSTRRAHHCPSGHSGAAVLPSCTKCTSVPSVLGQKGGTRLFIGRTWWQKKKMITSGLLTTHCIIIVFLLHMVWIPVILLLVIPGNVSPSRLWLASLLWGQKASQEQRLFFISSSSPQRKEGPSEGLFAVFLHHYLL